jgi:3',5'-cyclic AMP phosphodiesterase CpdA
MGVDRRNLLRAAVAVPAVPLVGAKRAPVPGFDATSVRFALAVLPDTQYLFDADSADPAPLRETFRFLLEHRAAENIVFLTHLGDVTEHGTAQEFAVAGETFRMIDGKFPYSVLAGNHDIDSLTTDQRGTSPYLLTFGPDRFRTAPTFVGASPDGYNSAHRIAAAGRSWLILALDWRISDEGVAWATAVLAANDVPTIVTTHDLAYSDDAGRALLSRNGRRMWDRLIRDHDQIFLSINGHDWPPGRSMLTNAAGNRVHVNVTNYQDRYYGGAGMIRLYHFDLERNRIDVETFSPWLLSRTDRTPLEAQTLELTGDDDRFSLEVDFAEPRFLPPPVPTPRSAAQVIDRDTVAYWRFDTPGQSVADGAVVGDQTGNGNDLTVRRFANSDEAVLTLTGDHHDAAPGPASLRFDGGTRPDRGVILQTGPAAALNSMTFLDGYTIELFVKLPEPFAGDHAFMGIFSWEGRSGDAGKHSGWTTLEPTCSLNLSSERFLQFVLYTADGDYNPTSWSHALPPGVWQHIAIVNDGRRGIIWVDGSPIVRNPARPSRGIATVGRPFVLGATSFDLRYTQGFYGWIGDVRITGRPLTPMEFLTGGNFSTGASIGG